MTDEKIIARIRNALNGFYSRLYTFNSVFHLLDSAMVNAKSDLIDKLSNHHFSRCHPITVLPSRHAGYERNILLRPP